MALFTKHALFKHNLCFKFMGHRAISTSFLLNSKKIAVVLSGCGVYDGSEIHEASAALVHLTRGGAEPIIYAPDQDQMHVVNHVTGEPSVKEKRNVLVESARIARGKIFPLNQLSSTSCDAVVFPGGFGAAKNLSTFATEGGDCKVIPEIEKIIKDFHSAKKPIALCCISPTLIARVLPKVQVTLGQDKDDGTGKWPYAGAAEAVKSWGATHINKSVNECVVDKINLIITTPAFMYDTKNFHEVYDGIGVMINSLFVLLQK